VAAGKLLVVRGLASGYGNKRVVFDIDLDVRPGEIVGIIGHNGAGKTTTLRSIFGTLPTHQGTVTYEGADITGRSPRKNVMSGISLIPSEHFVFADMTVRDNLLLGALHEKKLLANPAADGRNPPALAPPPTSDRPNSPALCPVGNSVC